MMMAALAFVLAVPMAQAATLATIEAKPGIDDIVFTGTLSVGGPGLYAFTGFGILGGDVLPFALFSDTGANAFTDPTLGSIAAGAPLEVSSGPGFLLALYEPVLADGTLAPYDLFVLRVETPAPGGIDPFAGGAPMSYAGSSAWVTAVQPVAAIPLPAGLPLILTALGSLIAMARRRRRRAPPLPV